MICTYAKPWEYFWPCFFRTPKKGICNKLFQERWQCNKRILVRNYYGKYASKFWNYCKVKLYIRYRKWKVCVKEWEGPLTWTEISRGDLLATIGDWDRCARIWNICWTSRISRRREPPGGIAFSQEVVTFGKFRCFHLHSGDIAIPMDLGLAQPDQLD